MDSQEWVFHKLGRGPFACFGTVFGFDVAID
jgi:hypothetical protein